MAALFHLLSTATLRAGHDSLSQVRGQISSGPKAWKFCLEELGFASRDAWSILYRRPFIAGAPCSQVDIEMYGGCNVTLERTSNIWVFNAGNLLALWCADEDKNDWASNVVTRAWRDCLRLPDLHRRKKADHSQTLVISLIHWRLRVSYLIQILKIVRLKVADAGRFFCQPLTPSDRVMRPCVYERAYKKTPGCVPRKHSWGLWFLAVLIF